MSKRLLPLFSSRTLMDSCFTLRTFTHWEFIFVYGVREWSSFILLCIAVQFSQHHLLKRLSFFHCIFSCFVEDYLTIELRVHIWALYSVPLVYVSVFMPVPCCLGESKYRNQWLSYTLTMKIQKGKLENRSIYYSTKNHKIPRNKPNQRGKGSVLEELENTHERNRRRHKKMEDHSKLMDQKNKHC